MENFLKKSENILPMVLWLFGMFIVYKFGLFSNFLNINSQFNIIEIIAEFFGININDIIYQSVRINKIIFGFIITCVTLLYYTRIKSMPVIFSLFLMINLIAYMCMKIEIIDNPDITSSVSYLLTIFIWHSYFFQQKTIINLVICTVLFSLICFINPIFSFSIMVGFWLSSFVVGYCRKDLEAEIGYTFTISLCGFIFGTISLIISGNVLDFTIFLKNSYQFGASISLLLTLLTCMYHSDFDDILPSSLDSTTKNIIVIGLTFVSTVIIGRLDSISYFMS